MTLLPGNRIRARPARLDLNRTRPANSAAAPVVGMAQADLAEVGAADSAADKSRPKSTNS